MIPAQALSRLLAVQPVLDAVERDQAAPRAAFDRLVIGQPVTGQVTSQRNGVSWVTIDGQTVAMRLPHDVKPGDPLKLRFAGRTPQPVFVLQSPDTLSGETPQLSPTARMLSDILLRAPQHTLPTLTPATPLLAKPAAQTRELALALRTALVRSGLFYESHLANWTVGQDSVEGLMQEPQNRLAAEAARMGAALSLPDLATASESRPSQAMQVLLSQQLQLLESPQLVWRGDVWPGRSLEWEVHYRPADAEEQAGASGTDAASATWESHLRLTLHELGTLHIHIKLDAQQTCSLALVAEKPGIDVLLMQHQPKLTAQLASAGCTLRAITVAHDVDA